MPFHGSEHDQTRVNVGQLNQQLLSCGGTGSVDARIIDKVFQGFGHFPKPVEWDRVLTTPRNTHPSGQMLTLAQGSGTSCSV